MTLANIKVDSVQFHNDEDGYVMTVTDEDGFAHVFNIQSVAIELLWLAEQAIGPYRDEAERHGSTKPKALKEKAS